MWCNFMFTSVYVVSTPPPNLSTTRLLVPRMCAINFKIFTILQKFSEITEIAEITEITEIAEICRNLQKFAEHNLQKIIFRLEKNVLKISQ